MLTSFAHSKGKIATRSSDPPSHGKGTFIRILLFMSFAHYGETVVTGSADTRSHDK